MKLLREAGISNILEDGHCGVGINPELASCIQLSCMAATVSRGGPHIVQDGNTSFNR